MRLAASIEGLPGVGKTELALHLVDRLSETDRFQSLRPVGLWNRSASSAAHAEEKQDEADHGGDGREREGAPRPGPRRFLLEREARSGFVVSPGQERPAMRQRIVVLAPRVMERV